MSRRLAAWLQLIGEKEFPTLSHEGERESIHISVIGRLLLMVVFDERSSLGLVKLRSKQVSHQLSAMIDEITELTSSDETPPSRELQTKTSTVSSNN